MATKEQENSTVRDHVNSSPETNMKTMKIGCGLVKIRNGCFFNSTLQALFHVPVLTDCFVFSSTKKCECVICTVQRLYQKTKRSRMPCDPTNVYKMLQKDDSFSKILDGTHDAHDFLIHLVRKMAHPSHSHINLESKFVSETNIDIKCLQCKIVYKNTNNATDFVVNMRGKRSVKEAFQTFFENEIIQKYNCIFCMKSVSASKKWKLLSTPKCLCLKISDSDCDIQINRDLIIKCFTEGRVRYWKYELASAINHVGASYDKQHYITTVQHNNTVYTLDDSKVQEKEGQAGCHPYILFYERTEEIHIDISTEWIPTVIIDESDSDDEFQIDTIIKSDGQNTENEIVTVDSNHQKQGNAKATKPKKSEHARPSERPRRILKRNRQFLDSGVWDNANNTSSSLSFHSPKPPISSTPHNLSAKTNVAIDLNDLSEKAPPKSDSPTLKVPGKTGKIGTKPKNFIRFRFQVDCTAANDVNIDELIIFLKNNMKIQGQKNNLVGVTIEKRKMNIHIMSKVMLKKKYLKSLSKKFLKKKRQMNYRVIEKNKRAYKIIAK